MGAQALPPRSGFLPAPFLFALLPRGNRQASGRTSLSLCFLFPTLGGDTGPPLGALCLSCLPCEVVQWPCSLKVHRSTGERLSALTWRGAGCWAGGSPCTTQASFPKHLLPAGPHSLGSGRPQPGRELRGPGRLLPHTQSRRLDPWLNVCSVKAGPVQGPAVLHSPLSTQCACSLPHPTTAPKAGTAAVPISQRRPEACPRPQLRRGGAGRALTSLLPTPAHSQHQALPPGHLRGGTQGCELRPWRCPGLGSEEARGQHWVRRDPPPSGPQGPQR